mgnify:CR=1 FL=1
MANETVPADAPGMPLNLSMEDHIRTEACARFHELYSDWLRVRADLNGSPTSDEEAARLLDREAELVRLIAVTPAPSTSLLPIKFEVLDTYMGGEVDRWDDRREVIIFAGIKADFHRLVP